MSRFQEVVQRVSQKRINLTSISRYLEHGKESGTIEIEQEEEK